MTFKIVFNVDWSLQPSKPKFVVQFVFQYLLSGKTIEEYRRQLGSFGVSGDLALQTVGSLSGGQKSRVAFSRMCMGNPNFLVLDEPTNHLDIETIEALGKAINKYNVSQLLFITLVFYCICVLLHWCFC